MPEKTQKIEQLMAEADELIRKINSEVQDDLEEKHQLELEKHAQNVEKIKSALQAGKDDDKTEVSRLTGSAEGMHEAMEDIVKAMKDLKNKLLK